MGGRCRRTVATLEERIDVMRVSRLQAEPNRLRMLGVVLCGGNSSRMGRDKALLTTPTGNSFLTHACERLKGLCDEVVLSVPHGSSLAYDLTQLPDPPQSAGPISGVMEALRYAADRQFDACLFTPIDTPSLTTSLLSDLLATSISGDQLACTAAVSRNDRLEPLISIIPIHQLPTFGQAIRNGKYRLQEVLRSIDGLRLLPVSKKACANINSPNDYESYLRLNEADRKQASL